MNRRALIVLGVFLLTSNASAYDWDNYDDNTVDSYVFDDAIKPRFLFNGLNFSSDSFVTINETILLFSGGILLWGIAGAMLLYYLLTVPADAGFDYDYGGGYEGSSQGYARSQGSCPTFGAVMNSLSPVNHYRGDIINAKQLLPGLPALPAGITDLIAGLAEFPLNILSGLLGLKVLGILMGLPLVGLIAIGPILLSRIFGRDSGTPKRQASVDPGFRVTEYDVDMSPGGYAPPRYESNIYGGYGTDGYGTDGYGANGYGMDGYGPSGYEYDNRAQRRTQNQTKISNSSVPLSKKRSFNPHFIDWETFTILDWIAIAEETWKKFEPSNLECQKRLICEVHQNAPKFGRIAKKMVDAFSYLQYAEVLRLPEDLKNLVHSYLDAADRGRSMKKECGEIYDTCDFSVKKMVDKVSHNEI